VAAEAGRRELERHTGQHSHPDTRLTAALPEDFGPFGGCRVNGMHGLASAAFRNRPGEVPL
jgi:hypothetical protein